MSSSLRFVYFVTILATFPFGRIVEFASLPSWKLCQSAYPPLLTVLLSFDYNSIGPLSRELHPWILVAIASISVLSLIAAAVGYKTDVTDWLSLLGLSCLQLYWSQFCFTTHELTPLPVSMLLWNLSFRSTDLNASVRFQRIHFCIVFFAAGVSKLLTAGNEWIHENSLQNILMLQNFLFEDAWLFHSQVALNQWLVNRPDICRILSISVLAIELGAPLALLQSRFSLHYLAVLAPAFMQIGILLVVYINFATWIPLYLFWIPETVWRRFDKKISRLINALNRVPT